MAPLRQSGWRQLDEQIEMWAGGDGECCRLLVGMQTLPQQEIAGAYGSIISTSTRTGALSQEARISAPFVDTL